MDSHSIKYQTAISENEKPVSDIVAAALSAVVEIQYLRGGNQPAISLAPTSPEPITPWSAGYGAIAWDRESGKIGWIWKQATPRRAAEIALSQCGASDCKVIIRTVPEQCAAVATTEDGKYIGAAARKTQDEARLAALTDCQKGKAGECVVRTSNCNK